MTWTGDVRAVKSAYGLGRGLERVSQGALKSLLK